MPTNVCSAGVLENTSAAIKELKENELLTKLLFWQCICAVSCTFITLTLIKMTNAMQKVMLNSMKTFIVWLFFLYWMGRAHEEWNFIKLLGMCILTIATCWYIHLD